MTETEPLPLRVISFGDLDGDVWGSVIDAGRPAIVFGTPDGHGSASGPGAVTVTEGPAGAKLTGDDFELEITPLATGPGDGAQLCRVIGRLAAGGAERAVECVGTRSTGDGVGPRRLDSVRALSGWFGPDRGLVLVAMRPARGRGHESDVVRATVFDPDGPIAVDDPRMSTTFREGYRPSRASLELWIGEGEEQHPRRAAAQASGEPAVVEGEGVKLQVTPLRCHAAGLDGAGVYVLARF